MCRRRRSSASAETENAAAARRGAAEGVVAATREPEKPDAREPESARESARVRREGGRGEKGGGRGEWRQTRRRERAREGKNPQPEKATRVDNVRTATYRPETRARMRRPPRDASVGGRGANASDLRVRARGRALGRPPRRRHRAGRPGGGASGAARRATGKNHRGAEDLNPQPRRGDRGRDRARPRRGGAMRTCATVADAPMDAIVKDAIMSKVELGRLRAPRDSNARRRRRGAAEKATKRARLDEMAPGERVIYFTTKNAYVISNMFSVTCSSVSKSGNSPRAATCPAPGVASLGPGHGHPPIDPFFSLRCLVGALFFARVPLARAASSSSSVRPDHGADDDPRQGDVWGEDHPGRRAELDRGRSQDRAERERQG